MGPVGRPPAGLPGSISWKAKLLGIPTYNLAMAAAGFPGKLGRQARFDLAMTNHQRLRRMALAAAQTPRVPGP